jgi:nitrogen regulatory protein P-II 1
MKLIEAVINKLKLQEVRDALDDMGVVDFMESSITCHTHQGRVMIFRGARFVASVVEKVKLEIVSADDAADKIIEAIGAIVKAGCPEDCRIAVRPYSEVT